LAVDWWKMEIFEYMEFSGKYGNENVLKLVHVSPSYAKSCKKLHFGPAYGGIRGNISALSESFNAKKLCIRVSSNKVCYKVSL